MSQGYSGSFAINGTRFLLSPESSKWVDKNIVGLDGNGFPIYPQTREYEMSWGLAHPNDVKQFIDFFTTSGFTGTVVLDLPEYGADDYKFKSYSGCVIQEPKFGSYFNGYITDVTLLVTKITT